MDFYDKLFKNCHFWPQNEPKGPQGPIETSQDHENNFFELPGYENPMLEKKFRIISHRKKVGLTMYQVQKLTLRRLIWEEE